MAREFVTQQAMDAALHASRAGRRSSETLVGNGDLFDDDLARPLADHRHIDHVDLDVPAGADDHAQMAQERSRVAERARALARPFESFGNNRRPLHRGACA